MQMRIILKKFENPSRRDFFGFRCTKTVRVYLHVIKVPENFWGEVIFRLFMHQNGAFVGFATISCTELVRLVVAAALSRF
jgi:hypothetical protein